MSSFLFRQMRPANFAAVFAVLAFTSAAAAQTAPAAQQAPAAALASPSAKAQAGKPPVEAPGSVTLTEVDSALGAVAASADSRLSDVSGTPELPNADVSALRPELEDMATRQRRIRKLQLQLQETQLSKELYETLYGESFTGDKKSDAQKAGGTGAAGVIPREPDPLPLVSSIKGTDGSFRATILVPYIGEVIAQRGDVLPNGMKVTAVTAKGVTVSDQGRQRLLAFGTDVPRSRTPLTMLPQFTPSLAPAQ